MTTPSSRKVSHAMFVTAAKLTAECSASHLEMWVSHQAMMYLTVNDVVYNIDLHGNYIARNKETGEVNLVLRPSAEQR